MDAVLCDYLEHLWSSGSGRAQACDTIAGVQDIQPNLRNQLPGSWRLLKTWSVHEVPCRAPPLPEHVLQAMAGWCFFHGHFAFGISLLVGFYTMLRTGEIIGLRSSHLLCGPQDKQIVISLGLTKSGKRHGAAESVILGFQPAVELTKRWKTLVGPASPFVSTAARWRKLFNECLVGLGIEAQQFRPYSLRRGGATFWFAKHQNMDRLLIQGRWASQKTARVYLNEGLSMLTSMDLPKSHPKLKPFLQIFSHTLQTSSPLRPWFRATVPQEPPSGSDSAARGCGGQRKLGNVNSQPTGRSFSPFAIRTTGVVEETRDSSCPLRIPRMLKFFLLLEGIRSAVAGEATVTSSTASSVNQIRPGTAPQGCWALLVPCLWG
eukprot:Skav203451  [mRNA]  locus=scaffold2237:7330:11377:- [translate_table: standard]